MKNYLLIALIILFGLIVRLVPLSNGDFLFNMDNARDFVDTREIVVLHKLRLTGPTSAIEGVYNGPAWYYMLSVPFILTGGHPYGAIVMEIIFWAIGGFFLLKLVSRYGTFPMIFTGLIWAYSNYIRLATAYSFNPSPVTLLTPLFVYLLMKYLTNGKLIYSCGAWFLGGIFFNLEMNVGIFVPLIIIVSILLSKKQGLFRTTGFWVGALFFITTIIPQIIFDFKHQFLMTKSLINYILHTPEPKPVFNPLSRFAVILQNFSEVLTPTFMNLEIFVKAILSLIVITIFILFRKNELQKNFLVLILLSMIIIPFLGYVLIPVTVNSWHLGMEAASFILLGGISFATLSQFKILGKVLIIFSCSLLAIFIANTVWHDAQSWQKAENNVSSFANELATVDFIYQKAEGKNFKVYAYLPSIIDYPYQYLFWWRGTTKYGYVPKDYAYLPNMPTYIANKDKLQGTGNPPDSGLVFLIKEPDRIGYRSLWEGNFSKFPLIDTFWIGPIQVEIRKEVIIK